MAIHGKATGIILGPFNLTRYFKSITVSQSTETADATMFMAEGKEYVAGMADSTVALSGQYDSTAAYLAAQFEAISASESNSPVLVAFGGWVVGSRVRIGTCKAIGLDVTSPVGDIVATSGNLQGDGALDGGVLLSPLAALSATTATTAVDAGASSATTAGGRMQLHVLANTRTATTAVVLQHSTNGSTWVDLYTFPATAAGATPALVGTITGTINRYTRILTTPAAGTGSVTLTAALARNN